MKCELCGNEIEPYVQPFVPVLKYVFAEHTEQRGIHLDCLKEILDVVRALTTPRPSHRVTVAPSTTEEEHNA